jgi:hypothetical protein
MICDKRVVLSACVTKAKLRWRIYQHFDPYKDEISWKLYADVGEEGGPVL